MKPISELRLDPISSVEQTFAAFGFALVKTNKQGEALSFEKIREVNHERWRDLLYFNPVAVQAAAAESVKSPAASIVTNPAATIPEPRGLHNSFYEWFNLMSSEDRITWGKFKKQFARHIVKLERTGASEEANYYRKRFLHLWGHPLGDELPFAPNDEDFDAKNLLLTKICARNLLIQVELFARENEAGADAESWCRVMAREKLIADRHQINRDLKTPDAETCRAADRYHARVSELKSLGFSINYEDANDEAARREQNARSLYTKIQSLDVELREGPRARKWDHYEGELEALRAKKINKDKKKMDDFISNFYFPAAASLRAEAIAEGKIRVLKSKIITAAQNRAEIEARNTYAHKNGGAEALRELDRMRTNPNLPGYLQARKRYKQQIEPPKRSAIYERLVSVNPFPINSF